MENKETQKRKNKITVCSINRVENFNPEAEAKEMLQSAKGEDEKIKTFLPLAAKKQWFRLATPEGKITFHEMHPALPPEMSFQEKKEILYDIDYVSVIARVYKNASDDTEAYLGEGYGVVYASDPSFINLTPEKRYPEMLRMAIGCAESRALYNAGFGLQFYGDDVELIDEIAKEPDQVPKQKTSYKTVGPSLNVNMKDEDVQKKFSLSENGFVPETEEPVKESEKKGRRTYQQIYEDSVRELDEIFKQAKEADEMITIAKTDIERVSAENRMEKVKSAWEKTVASMQKAVDKGAKAESGIVLKLEQRLSTEKIKEEREEKMETENADKSNPVVSQMTVFMPSIDDAKAITCTFGTYSGRTYGEIYDHQKNMLIWLYNKDLPQKEKEAVETLCTQDAELKAKLERL